MSKIPYMPLYTSDFIEATQLFNNAEIGSYILLLMYQFQNGFIPSDEKSLKIIAKTSKKNLKKVLEKFDLVDGAYINLRAKKERDRYLEKSEKARASVNKRWNKNDTDVHTNVLQTNNERIQNVYTINPNHTILDNTKEKDKKEKDKKESVGVTPPSPPPKRKTFKYDLEFLNTQENQPYKKCFMDWLEYKKERRENYKSQKTLETALSGLKKLSENNPQTAERIVLNSITSNIQGLYPLKNGNNKTSTGMATKATGINYDE